MQMILGLVLLLLLPLSPALAQDSNSTSNDPQLGTNVPNSDAASTNSAGGGSGSSATRPTASSGRAEVKAPRVIHSPDPDYPEAARLAGYGGTVVLRLIVDTDGKPEQIKIARALGMGLDAAAIGAVKTWRFEPAMKDGQPVPVQISVEVNFRTGLGEPTNLPLHPPSQASATPPQFPGADLKKYPLVVYISDVVPMPMGKRYEVRATASLNAEDSSKSKTTLLVCESNRNHCALIWKGYYPARWIVQNQQLELIGLKGSSSGWEKAEYTVAAPTNP